jgi:hypothetical protein
MSKSFQKAFKKLSKISPKMKKLKLNHIENETHVKVQINMMKLVNYSYKTMKSIKSILVLGYKEKKEKNDRKTLNIESTTFITISICFR